MLGELAAAGAENADGTGALEHHTVDLETRLDTKVRPILHGVEVGRSAAGPRAVSGGELVPADAVLSGAIEILVGQQPDGGGGIEERMRQPGSGRDVRDGQGS